MSRQKWPKGNVFCIMGRSSSGKSTLAREVKELVPKLVIIDDGLRRRNGISGSSMKAYIKMAALADSLSLQGIDVVICGGLPFRETRDYLRSELPDIKFFYLEERGRSYPKFEEPEADENIIGIGEEVIPPEAASVVMGNLVFSGVDNVATKVT